MNRPYYRNAQGMLVKEKPSIYLEILGAVISCAIVAALVFVTLVY